MFSEVNHGVPWANVEKKINFSSDNVIHHEKYCVLKMDTVQLKYSKCPKSIGDLMVIIFKVT